MSISFPTALDNFSNPTATSDLSNPSHSQQHADLNDAVEALQLKVGITNSADTNSLDYKIANVVGGGGSGTVTSVSVTTANGVSGSVATATTTPAITLTLGAITPSAIQVSGLTASQILSTDASKNLTSLAVATYPSLTELAFVKGVTSAIQTQINAKGAGTVTAVSVTSANGVSGSSSGGATPALTIALGAITPTTVNSVTISGSATPTLSVTGTTTVSGSNTGDQTISDATISTSDITTNNFTTAKHGFVPKGTNIGSFLKDDGTWGTPAGAGDMALASVQTVTGAKTFGTIGGAVGKFILAGSTSGSTIVNAAAVAGSTTMTLPTASTTLIGTDTTDTLTNKTLTSPKINENVVLTTTATKLNLLTSATGTTGTASTNIVFSASPTFTGTVTLPVGLTGVIRTDTGVVSVDTDVTDIVSAASTSAAGKVELAITSEIDTGTDSTRAMPVDQFVASARNVRYINWRVLDPTTDWPADGTTKVGGDFVFPFAGTIVSIRAEVDTAGTTGTSIVDVNKDGATIMTTNKLKWDSTEKSTSTYSGTAPGLTDTALSVGSVLTVDIDTNHTTKSKGLTIMLGVRQT